MPVGAFLLRVWELKGDEVMLDGGELMDGKDGIVVEVLGWGCSVPAGGALSAWCVDEGEEFRFSMVGDASFLTSLISDVCRGRRRGDLNGLDSAELECSARRRFSLRFPDPILKVEVSMFRSMY